MRRLIIICFAVSLLTGCQDYLNLKPKNQTVVGTMKDVKDMMASYLYSLTSSNNYPIYFNNQEMRFPYNRDAVASFTMYSDNIDMTRVLGHSYGKKYEKEYYESVDWKSSIFSKYIWDSFYLHVGYMNSVLKSLEELLGDYDQATYEKVKGEALTIRAFHLFKILQLFAPYDNNELGIPVNYDPDILEGTPRLTQKEVYARIIGDLTTALNYETPGDSWNIFYTKDIIHALLAQVYMFKAESAAKGDDDWNQAEIHSDYIVQRYAPADTKEDIAAVLRPGTGGVFKSKHCLLTLGWAVTPRSNLYSFWGSPGANKGQFVDEELLKLYSPEDYRLDLFFAGTEQGEKVYNKYEFVSSVVADYILLFRVEDMYLICAEANTRLNRPKGKELLETFKKTRIPGYTTYAGNDVLDEIIRERRKEFCGEYDMRWLDMKRLKMKISRIALNDKGLTEKIYTLESDDYRYALRIPVESELSFNKIPQNPGWN